VKRIGGLPVSFPTFRKIEIELDGRPERDRAWTADEVDDLVAKHIEAYAPDLDVLAMNFTYGGFKRVYVSLIVGATVLS